MISSQSIAAPGDILYLNQFSNNSAITSDWTRTGGGGNDFQASSDTFNSAPRSLLIRNSSGGTSNNGLINAAVTGADVTFWLRQGSPSNAPEAGENLEFYYLNNIGSWVLLTTYFGSDPAGTTYNASFTLPADALHANLRFQFNMTSGGNNDRWYVDDFTVTETGVVVPPTAFSCDNFETGLSQWTTTSNGGSAGISGATFNSASNSLYTRWGDVTLTSSIVSTALFAQVEVTAWVRRGDDSFSEDPDNNEDLVLSYFNSSNAWVILETFPGNGTPGEIFNRTYTLPASAIHSNFRLRIAQIAGNGSDFDYWHLDDVCIQEYQPPVLGSCAAYFADTIQGNSNASNIRFRNTGRVINDPNNILTFPSLTNNTNNNHNTCNTVDCSVTASPSLAFSLPIFVTTSTNTDVIVNSGTSTIGPGGDFPITEIDQLIVSNTANITFLASASTYIINNGDFSGSSQITFNPGTYWFNELVITGNTNIIINGPVTIFVNGQNNHLDIEDDVTINTSGAAENLTIVSYSTIHLKNNVVVKAVLYGTGSEIGIRDNARLIGAISASGRVQIVDAGTVTYEDVSGVQVATLCGAPPSSLDHFEITHDGSALTCAPETLTIKACADASCSTVATSDISLSLTATGAASAWSQNPITITGGSSAGVTVDLTHTTAETVTLGATGVPIASNPVVCNSPSGCNLGFSEAGFILTLDNHTSCSVPNLTIQAVKLSDTGTSCAPAYTGSQLVNFSFVYNNPSAGSQIPTLASTNMSTVPETRSIIFDANGSVDLTFQYMDAGQLDIIVSDAAGTGLTSSTVSPVVVPAKLIVSTSDANNACTGPDFGADSGDCNVFKVAGTAGNAASQFALDVAGVCADNSITPNFQLNNIALTSNLVAPSLASGASADGSNASLGVTTVNITSNGTAKVNQTISEVGVFTITATPGNYMGLVLPAILAGTSEPIGRFIPDRFVVEIKPADIPYFTDANVSCGFTYQDQPFNFDAGLDPIITLTAVNSAGATTLNYGGQGVANNDFWKLDSNLLSTRTYINQVATFPGTLTASLGTIITAGENDYDGINTFTFTTDQLTYNKFAAVPVALPAVINDAAFDASVKLNLTAASLTDSDGVAIIDAFTSNNITGTNIRWGRWFIDNAFGSELQPLQMVAQAQYFDGTNFVTNSTDTCSTPVTTTLSNYTGNLVAGDTSITQAVMVVGLIPLTLSAPGATNDGSTQITLTGFNWMLYDFNGDTIAENASATATFGIFEGRKPVIFWRQRY